MFQFAYNTNGLAHHRLLDAFELLAELGYTGVAVTPDVGELDPYALRPGFAPRLRARAEELGLTLALETGARYLLDPRHKHAPSLLDPDAARRERRIDFCRRSIDLAHELGAGLVSIWSGCAPGNIAGDARGVAMRAHEPLWDRLEQGLAKLLAHARGAEVRIAFEPEPGMFVERPTGYFELKRRLGAELGLTLDVGHLLVTRDLPVADVIRAYAHDLAHVHLDDIQDGVHEHCMFGKGELDLPATLRALASVGFSGMAAVELSRDSYRGAVAAGEAMAHLRAALSASNSA
jgi:L-ribulose-5-phosphate 3-epimerase